jgi:hypothetical protein
MNDLITAIFAISIVGGLYYFWYKCRIFAVSKLLILFGIFLWPVSSVVGIYWAIKDYFYFRNLDNTSQNNDAVINNSISVTQNEISDDVYLLALNEYESENRDKALYARLFAENDGKEEIVKAKYIRHRVQKMSGSI